VRRIAVLVSMLAIAAATSGLVPGGLVHWKHANAAYETIAGGWTLVAMTM